MNNNDTLQWKVTSLKIPSNEKHKTIIDAFKNEGISLRNESANHILENQKNHFIYENEYLAQSKNILTNIAKYSEKKYGQETKVYSQINGDFSYVKAESKDMEKYKQVLGNNILDGDHREIPISPNILNEVFDESNQSRVFFDIVLLFFLANKCKYDAETIQAEFKTEENIYQVKLNITESTPFLLYNLYDWVINKEEYENSFEVKLQIAREVIAKRKDLANITELLEDCKLSFKRIISRKTNDYFEQLNKLKDDFLIMSKNENSILRTLHLTFFAWLGYLGIELFNIITNYEGSDILSYLLYSGGAKKGIVIFLFAIAFIAIYIGYVLEIYSLKKTYNVIKEIYKDKILFETNTHENKFEDMISEPKVGKLHTLVFILIIVVLFIRLHFTCPWQ